MAERKTVIEYAFQGDTLNLQQAIKQVNSLLRTSVKQLKEFQEGTLTDQQKEQVKVLKQRLKDMKAATGVEASLSAEEKNRVKRAGTFALKQAQVLSKQATKAKTTAEKEQTKAAAEQEKERLKQAELVTVAVQENASQHADFLDNYADKFEHTLSSAAYKEIKNAVAAFRAVQADSNAITADATSSDEELETAKISLATATQKLQDTYKGYSETLQSANRAQQQAARSILNLKDFIAEAGRQIQVTVKTFSFWLQVIRLLYKAVQDYVNLISKLKDAGMVSNKQIEGVIRAAEAWKTFNKQIKLFMTNVGALVMQVLAPIINVLAVMLMLINALISAFTGVAKVAEAAAETKKGIGLTDLDEINQAAEQTGLSGLGEDVDNLITGMDDIAGKLAHVMELFQLLGSTVQPVFAGISEGLFLIVNGFVWLIDTITSAITWFFGLFGITSDWNKEGSIMGEVLRYIGLLLSGVVAIGFALLIKNLALSAIGFVKMAAKTLIAAAAAIKNTIATWLENASLAAKIGLLTFGVGLGIVAIVLAATGAFSQKAAQTPDVPQLAKGGIATGPTLAEIGEGRFDEAVIPLGNSPQFNMMTTEIAEKTISMANYRNQTNTQANMSMNTSKEVTLVIDGRTLGRVLIPYISEERPNTGVRMK